MRYELLGAILGGVIGFCSPILFCFALASLDGFKPGGLGSAATAFVFFIPITTIYGVFRGAAKGRERKKSGKWNLWIFRKNKFDLPDLEGAGEDYSLARSLSSKRLSWLQSTSHEDSVIAEQELFLMDSIRDFRVLFWKKFQTVAIMAFISIPFYLFWLFVFYLLFQLIKEVFLMRSRLVQVANLWDINVALRKYDLPIALQLISNQLQSSNGS